MSYVPAVSYRFLHVGINFRSGVMKVKELEPIFDRAPAWYRYGPGGWILVTNESIDTWYGVLKPHLSDQDYFLIAELNMKGYQGWLPADGWKWVEKHGGVP